MAVGLNRFELCVCAFYPGVGVLGGDIEDDGGDEVDGCGVWEVEGEVVNAVGIGLVGGVVGSGLGDEGGVWDMGDVAEVVSGGGDHPVDVDDFEFLGRG